MRVAYICADPGIPVFGSKGASVHVQEVIRSLLRQGAEVELFATRIGGDVPLGLEPVRLHALPAIPKGSAELREQAALSANAALRAALEEAGPFTLVYERYSLWSFAGMEYASDCGIPGLLEVNAPLIEEQARHRSLVDREGAERVASRLFDAATALIAVSEEVGSYLGSFPGTHGRIHVIPNGVDPHRFRPGLAPAFPAEPGAFTVGFVGTLKPWHGLETLVDAFGWLHLKAPNSRLLIVGDGPLRESLEQSITERGLRDATLFTGAVDPEEVPICLASMDVAVAPYPALDEFYFSPLKVYEYMAAGVPVVASRIGQLTEVIEEGKNGLLFPPGDIPALATTLEHMRRDPALRERLARGGRATVLNGHTWDDVARRILDLATNKDDTRRTPEYPARKGKTARLPGTLTAIVGLGRVARRFWPLIRPHMALVLLAILALLAEIGLRLLEPWPLKLVFDHILGSEGSLPAPLAGLESAVLLALAAVGVVASTGLRAGAEFISTVCLAQVGNRVVTGVRKDLYAHLLRLSLSYHTRSRGGDLLTRLISDIGRLQEVTVTALLPLFINVITFVGIVAVMFWMHWRLALVALVVFPLVSLSMVRLGGRIREVARKQRQREGAMAATAAESLNAIKVVHAFSLESSLERLFGSQNQKNVTESVKGARLAARMERTVDVLLAASTALVLWYGTRLVIQKALTPGDLLVFMTYLKSAFRPMRDLAKYTGRIAKATAAGERVLDVLDTPPEVRDHPGAIPAPRFRGALRFERVSFGYERGHPVLDKLDFQIQPGQCVALVGASGSGKSTLASLLLRLYEPQSGRILVDGQDIRAYTLASARAQMSVVLQESVLFAVSIRENIAYGLAGASDEAIEAAARRANAHDFIAALPEGYDTILGERGATLSGGQRQRIAIARAALRGAPIVILDEPTTGLDQENERTVREALSQLTDSCTTLLITHDLRAAERADRILYLERGRVVEQGTHRELLARGGRYAATYRLQTGDFDEPARREERYALLS